MQSKVPHDILTISEMTRRPCRTVSELIDVEDMVLTEELVKKLRASSSMFNKRIYVQLMYRGIRYNVERVDRMTDGQYRISLISPSATAILEGTMGGKMVVSRTAEL